MQIQGYTLFMGNRTKDKKTVLLMTLKIFWMIIP